MAGLTTPTFILLVGICFTCIRLYHKVSAFAARSSGRPLPPGPPRLPLIGNLFDLPKGLLWEGYRELARKYGNIVYLEVMGQRMLLLNDTKTATDLLEKRSAIYSSRPASNMVEMGGWEWALPFMPYELLATPEKLNEGVRYAVGAAICKMAHGLHLSGQDDHRIDIFERALRSVDVLTQGSTILEFFPFLTKLPTWLPGTGFLRRLAEDRNAAHMLRALPWIQAKEMIMAGDGPVSIASAMMEKLSHVEAAVAEEEEGIAMSVAGMSYAAGLDTQFATLQSLFLALSLYPHVQEAAQAQLDAVVGRDRLPTFEDRPALPYVNAVVKELLRWHSSVPLSVARCNIADDQYDGYFIPANTIIIPNTWAMAHDEVKFAEPSKFLPERYLKDGKLNPDAEDPASIVFGFGRRICPGRHLADSLLFIYVACVLHAFEIAVPLDDVGQPMITEPRPTNGIISCLEDYPCTIKPRFTGLEALIRQGAE